MSGIRGWRADRNFNKFHFLNSSLGSKFSNVHPIAFHVGPLAIHWYGVMMALGVPSPVCGPRVDGDGPRMGVPPERILGSRAMALSSVPFLGRANLVCYFLTGTNSLPVNPFSEIFMVQHGGLVLLWRPDRRFIGLYPLLPALKPLPIWKGADILAPQCRFWVMSLVASVV